MAHVTFVHGLANKPPADTLIRIWADALGRDDPRPQQHANGNSGLSLDNLGATYRMVYWADVLYPSPDTQIESNESYDDEKRQLEGISTDPSGALERAAAEDTSWREQLSPAERASVERLERELRFEVGTKEIAARAAGAAALERVPLPEFIKKPLMERLLRDLHHYFYNVSITPRAGETYHVRDELQRRFLAAVTAVGEHQRPHIVVSHSMGTIIAYDCIRNREECPPIDALLTVGSPLGLDEVQDQLKRDRPRVDFPPARLNGAWINVYDSLDPVVGFDPQFANDYRHAGGKRVRDRHEPNWGWWRHSIVKYLAGPRLREFLKAELLAADAAVGMMPAAAPPPPAVPSPLESLSPRRAKPKVPPARSLPKLSNVAIAEAATAVAHESSATVAARDRPALVELMDELRRRRMYPEMTLLGTSAGVAPLLVSTPRLARLLAQAWIEQSHFEHAEELLRPIAAMRGTNVEVLEARGLLGRIAKQHYVSAAALGNVDADVLRTAIDRYLDAYLSSKAKDRPLWHGINAAALLARAARDGITHKQARRTRSIARDISAWVRDRFDRSAAHFWDLATAGEAHLVLGDFERAELWYRRYAEAQNVEPFALASTLRQLQEIWGLSSTQGPGRLILPPLQQALARIGQTAMLLPEQVLQSSSESLEKIFGEAAFMSYDKLRIGLERCKAIGRVETLANDGLGTGFAVPGRSLRTDWDEKLVFVTNEHVISETFPDALPAASAQVTFHALRGRGGKPVTTRVDRILGTSAGNGLDYTIVSLRAQPKGVPVIPIAPRLPSVTGNAQVFVIGHPRGGGMMFSLQDNKLLDHGYPSDARVHYRAPTEPGSSGSPVFNTSWELIALHHSGSASMQKMHEPGTYEANEGLWIQAIIDHARESGVRG